MKLPVRELCTLGTFCFETWIYMVLIDTQLYLNAF